MRDIAYKPTTGVVEYTTPVVGMRSKSISNLYMEERDLQSLNTLASQGWHVVQCTPVGERSVLYTLERGLQ